MTQQNVRGAYFRPEHDRPQDWDWLAKWQPNVIRLMVNGKAESPNSVSIDQIQRVHDTCPQATILLRVWEIDDNNFHAHEAMVANPTAEAEKQLNWWAGLFDRLSGIPRNLLMAGLNNETGPDKDASLYPYTERALQIGTARAIRLGVFVFSVGRPSLPDEAEWTIDSFARLDNAVLANHGAIILHEYFQPEGMYTVWTDDQGHERKDYTYLVGRHMRWNVKSPIIIAEWGLNGLLYNRHPDPQWGDSGWLNFKKYWPPSRYADEYVECVRQASPNVIGICPFISDWSDHHWQSFDLIEAYEEFLARKDLCVKEISGTPPAMPTPTPPATTTMYVSVPSGARIRSAPVIRTDNILGAVAYGEPVIVTNYTADHSWAEVGYKDIRGWMSSALLSSVKPPVIPTTPPVPTPTPTPTPTPSNGALDPLMLEAIVMTESSGNGFENSKLKIRMEAHLLLGASWGNPAAFKPYFRYDAGNVLLAYYRRSASEPWIMYHLNQNTEWAAFDFARKLDSSAALRCTSMGAGQIMGFNAQRIGYATPKLMFDAFSTDEIPQTIGVVNYCLSDSALVQAIRDKDFSEITTRYNGVGLEAIYTPRLMANYQRLGGVI